MQRWVLAAVLALGGFGIGVSEFLIMGLLPQIALDLLPELFRAAPDNALAATGILSSAYAIGVVAGILVTPLAIRRMSERNALLICAGSMLVWTVLTALAPTFAVAVALRFLSALTHASYIGVGAMAVAHAFGTKNYGRGSAVVHGGLAAANLLGVPALTALGAFASWRLILGGASLLFALPLIVIFLVGRNILDRTIESDSSAPLQSNATRALSWRLMLLIAATVFVAAGGFTIVTYVAPVTEWTQGDATLVSTAGAMLLFGIGMNIGNFGAGWLADRAAALAFAVATACGVLGVILLITLNGAFVLSAALALIGIMLGGGSPAAQVLFIHHLHRFPRLASSLPSGTANLGSFTGSLFGAGLLAAWGTPAVTLGALFVVLIGVAAFVTQRLTSTLR
ncbi:MAG: MFS transporter [Canibacter sp.]